MWLNEYEVEDAVHYLSPRASEFPNLLAGALTLQSLVRWTNRNSDGWPYWQKPSRAAKSLMEHLHREAIGRAIGRWDQRTDHDLTDAELKRALAPIKAFRTRHSADFDIITAVQLTLKGA